MTAVVSDRGIDGFPRDGVFGNSSVTQVTIHRAGTSALKSEPPSNSCSPLFGRLLGSWMLGVPWSLGFGAWDLALYL
jgi:hypothetical protein